MTNLTQNISQLFWPDDPVARRDRLLLIGSGILLAAAWPPLQLGFLSYLALVLPLNIISRRNFSEAFKGGFLFAFIYHLASIYWIGWVTVPGMVAAVVLISLYTAFILGLFGELYQRSKSAALILIPFLWIGVEYFRTLTEMAFPWPNLSYTQWAYIPLIQMCEYAGDLGLSFLILKKVS